MLGFYLLIALQFVALPAFARDLMGLPPTFTVTAQSNAAGGCGWEDGIPADGITPVYPNLHERSASRRGDSPAGTPWRPLTQPWMIWSDSLFRRTPWPAAEREYIRRFGRRARFILAAQGGTCLASDHDGAPGEPSWDPDTGANYALAVDMIANTGSRQSLVANLWWGGECEISYPVTHEVMEAALENFAQRFYEDTGAKTIVAPIPRDRGACGDPYGGSQYGEIQQAVLDAAADSPYIYNTVADTSGLEWQTDNCAHFFSCTRMAERWIDAIEANGLY